MITMFLITLPFVLYIIKMCLLFSFLESCKMASTVVVTPDSSLDKSSRFYLVTWVNNLLKTNFKDVRQMGSGDSLLWAKLRQFFNAPGFTVNGLVYIRITAVFELFVKLLLISCCCLTFKVSTGKPVGIVYCEASTTNAMHLSLH